MAPINSPETIEANPWKKKAQTNKSESKVAKKREKVKMKSVVIAMFVALSMVLFTVKPGQAITCQQVEQNLAPCLPYLTSENGTPAQVCCDGLTSLKQNTPQQADRQQACQCIKDAATRYHNISNGAAKNLPDACKVQINVPVTTDVNCQEWVLFLL